MLLETAEAGMMRANILSTEHLSKHYPLGRHGLLRKQAAVRAVEDVTLEVQEGEVFGLVGESGCGKSTLGRALLRLEEPTSGRVFYRGQDLGAFERTELKAFRREAQIIYQDPYSALNPRQRIQDLIQEPLDIHGVGTQSERARQVARLLEKVGLRPDHASRYPHEFSGGQRQRIVIARALALNPKIILADEAVSALDVSIQAQVINLLKDLRREFNLTYIFISHDLSVIKHIADRVGVMYLGRLVESAPKHAFYQDPYSALNPRQRIQDLVQEPLDIHGVGTKGERSQQVARLLEKVGLRPDHASRYPHEFSGGQRQRIVIARALALNPKIILADEAVSALDVSIQAQVINLLKDLRREFNLTYIFISHDLSVIKHIADRVGVMYLGRLVESAPKHAFYQDPSHPYSRALLSSAPVPDPRNKTERTILRGDVPSPINPPSGCHFHPRCPECLDICREVFPPLRLLSPQRWVACHLYA